MVGLFSETYQLELSNTVVSIMIDTLTNIINILYTIVHELLNLMYSCNTSQFYNTCTTLLFLSVSIHFVIPI